MGKLDVCISRKKDGTFFYEIGTHLLYIRMVFSAGVIGSNKGPKEKNANNLLKKPIVLKLLFNVFVGKFFYF